MGGGTPRGTQQGPDRRRRCGWCGADADYTDYHDREWGRPVTDDSAIFEKLCLEGFQAGLSWLTILRKRENFRRAFAGFDPLLVADFGEDDVERLCQDAGIVRHRGKIEAAIANAHATLEVQATHGSLAALVWSFEPARRGRPAPRHLGELAPTTPQSTALARELRRNGFRFLGATTVHAAMQSLGLVNDHLWGCSARAACDADRRATVVPERGGIPAPQPPTCAP